MSSLRFGLVGTGYWARTIHAVALSGAADVQLAGVWGRDPVKTAALAEGAGTTGPHALAMLTATLGPVRRMTADHGAHDIVHLVLHHENAATSMATTVSAPTAAATSALTLWARRVARRCRRGRAIRSMPTERRWPSWSPESAPDRPSIRATYDSALMSYVCWLTPSSRSKVPSRRD